MGRGNALLTSSYHVHVPERQEAAKRRENKATKKKARDASLRKATEDKVRAQLERAQTLRSSVFAAARSGDAFAVKKGIWEDSVDASGGEVRKGSEAFVRSMPKDNLETLAHITARGEGVDLLEWLDTHGMTFYNLI